jgi:hypothetical protein
MTRTHHIPSRLKPFFTGFVALLLFGLVACKKDTPNNPHDPNTLPPLTHEGKNTFGCKVNGEVWVAHAPFTVGGPIALSGSYNHENGGGDIDANLSTDIRLEQIRLYFRGIVATGTYQMYLVSSTKSGMNYYTNPPNCSIYYHDTSNVGVMNITYFNYSSRIMSGSFQMDLINPSCPGDTIRIREGRFDWRF